jgi:hypothetical protein
VLSSTSSSDYLDIEGTPGRFSAVRESQYRGRLTAPRNRAGWGEIARRSTRQPGAGERYRRIECTTYGIEADIELS